ncbi:hypothetical protein F4778DRAFT_783767 [Xylariomycetidae sp. FL2044]|nr:hypothetical protein F4778DRAFT_783767 [Xylariomycetidae sp. FL2044]
MTLDNDLNKHPTPVQVYEIAVRHATLLRLLFTHPDFKYREPPTADVYKIGPGTNPGLFYVTDFVENTYVKNVIPLLPAGATRKCKALANTWAYADPEWVWEWTWDTESGVMRDHGDGDGDNGDNGNRVVEFPRMRDADEVREWVTDLVIRGVMTRKLVLEKETDEKARYMMAKMDAEGLDFGEDVRRLVAELD